MKLLVLLALVGLATAAIVQHSLTKIESKRTKMIKAGKLLTIRGFRRLFIHLQVLGPHISSTRNSFVLLRLPRETTTLNLLPKMSTITKMSNTLVTSPSEPPIRLSSSFWILDPQIFGFPIPHVEMEPEVNVPIIVPIPPSVNSFAIPDVVEARRLQPPHPRPMPVHPNASSIPPNPPPTLRMDNNGPSNMVPVPPMVSSDKIPFDSVMLVDPNLLFPPPSSDKPPPLQPSSLKIPLMVFSDLPSNP